MSKNGGTQREGPFVKYLEQLSQKDWDVTSDVPLWEKGNAVKTVQNWHDVNYLDYCEKLMGRPYGANGIGRLREAALTMPSEEEFHPYWVQDPPFFTPKTPSRVPDVQAWKTDIDLVRQQYEEYARILGENGVEVHWVEMPSASGPFGPWHRPSGATCDLWVLNGGIVVGKYGSIPFNNGRAAMYARWAFQELGIPILLTIHGKGVSEISTCVWLADDVLVTALSASFNQEGLDQFIPVVKASSRNDVYVHVMHLPNNVFWDPDTGACAHPNVIIGALDIGKVLVYAPAIDFETHRWLHENKFDVVEVDRDDYLDNSAGNIVTLEPGKVAMNAAARDTIKKVRNIGVEVVEVDFGAGVKATGYGRLDCVTAKLRRDPGPSFFKD